MRTTFFSTLAGHDTDTPSPNDVRTITLISNDQKRYSIDQKSACISTLVRTLLEFDEKSDELRLATINGDILEHIVDYMKEHKGLEPPPIQTPLRSKLMKDVCPHTNDADYIDKIGENPQRLCELMSGAKYMDIKSLMELCGAKVASLIKGKPFHKIKEIFNNAPQNKNKDEKRRIASSFHATKSGNLEDKSKK